MPDAMIAMRPKRSATQAQRRLHKADPTLAALMVEWEADLGAALEGFAASLEREYELAASTDPAPPIFDEEEKLAYKLGELDLSLDSFLKVADSVRGTRDEACMVLGRVEQDIAQRTLELIRLTPQAALPPPPDSFDGGDPDEDFHGMRADHDRWDAGEADRRWLINHLQAPLDEDGHGWVHAGDERMEDLVRAHEKEHRGDRSTRKQAHASGEWFQRTVGTVIDPEPEPAQDLHPAFWGFTKVVRVGGWWRRVRGWLRPASITAAAILLAITLGGGS